MEPQTGKLLSRTGGSATAPHPNCSDTGRDIAIDVCDPLSDNFVIPPGIPPTPRGIAIFFTNRLRTRFDCYGNPWVSGWPLKAHLRPAKVLLEEYGYENAIRAIVRAVSIAGHRPSFAFVLRCAREMFGERSVDEYAH